MRDEPYKFGIYFDSWNRRYQMFGFGIVWSNKKYIHFNLFNYKLTIGKTTQ